MNEMAKKKESTPGENLAKQIIEQYHPKSVTDMQDALPPLVLEQNQVVHSFFLADCLIHFLEVSHQLLDVFVADKPCA